MSVFVCTCQVPFYKGENIKFDVIPERLELVVEHESVDIKVGGEHFMLSNLLMSPDI